MKISEDVQKIVERWKRMHVDVRNNVAAEIEAAVTQRVVNEILTLVEDYRVEATETAGRVASLYIAAAIRAKYV